MRKTCPFCGTTFDFTDPTPEEAPQGYEVRCPNGHLVSFIYPAPPSVSAMWWDDLQLWNDPPKDE